eukprot:4720959-Prymnesium_polylepis.1
MPTLHTIRAPFENLHLWGRCGARPLGGGEGARAGCSHDFDGFFRSPPTNRSISGCTDGAWACVRFEGLAAHRHALIWHTHSLIRHTHPLYGTHTPEYATHIAYYGHSLVEREGRRDRLAREVLDAVTRPHARSDRMQRLERLCPYQGV